MMVSHTSHGTQTVRALPTLSRYPRQNAAAGRRSVRSERRWCKAYNAAAKAGPNGSAHTAASGMLLVSR
jgi:hypothetical protein